LATAALGGESGYRLSPVEPQIYQSTCVTGKVLGICCGVMPDCIFMTYNITSYKQSMLPSHMYGPHVCIAEQASASRLCTQQRNASMLASGADVVYTDRHSVHIGCSVHMFHRIIIIIIIIIIIPTTIFMVLSS